MDDANNPAVSSQLAISPRFLQEVVDNPKLLKQLQTKLYVIHMHQMHMRLRTADAPMGQKQSYIDHLAKAADINPKELTGKLGGGPGFSVNIVLGDNRKAADVQKVEVVENPPAAPMTVELAQPNE